MPTTVASSASQTSSARTSARSSFGTCKSVEVAERSLTASLLPRRGMG
jgi:hypothetical protein